MRTHTPVQGARIKTIYAYITCPKICICMHSCTSVYVHISRPKSTYPYLLCITYISCIACPTFII